MKKKTLSLILVGISIFIFTGCVENKVNAEQENHIEVIFKESIPNTDITLTKVKDKNTGDEFMISEGYRSGGITQIK